MATAAEASAAQRTARQLLVAQRAPAAAVAAAKTENLKGWASGRTTALTSASIVGPRQRFSMGSVGVPGGEWPSPD